ncbi:MAG: M24 family metallopeptidase, partial [Terriglobales bacterium]
MRQARVDGFLVSHLPNVRYLSGFSGSNALLLLAQQRTFLFTDGRYREQARQEVREAQVIVVPSALWGTAAKRAAKLSRVAVESEYVSLAQRRRWREAWSGRKRTLVEASGWVEQLRSIKEPEEIEAIRRAVKMASRAFRPALARVRPGVSETEAAGWLEYCMRRQGGEGLAFETILAGGAHGAVVHAHPGAQPLPQRGFVVMDYGLVLDGYHSDMTRTVHLGEPGAKARRVYRAVREAQEAALAAVRPGAPCAAIDKAARDVIDAAGYGDYFIHRVGHGL